MLASCQPLVDKTVLPSMADVFLYGRKTFPMGIKEWNGPGPCKHNSLPSLEQKTRWRMWRWGWVEVG